MAVGSIGLVLQPIDLDAEVENLARPLERGKKADRPGDRLAAVHQNLRELLGVRFGLLDLEENDALAHRFGEVEHVVERGDEAADVGRIERRDPGLVQTRDGLVRDLVALVLEVADLFGEGAGLSDVFESRGERLCGLDEAGGVTVESLVEDAVAVLRADHARSLDRIEAGGSLVRVV